MNIEVQRAPKGIAIAYLSGDLDTNSLRIFKKEIQELVQHGFEKIIVDCRELGFISSSGLAALLWARSSSGTIYLTSVSSLVSDVLQVTGMARLFRIESTTRRLLTKLGAIRQPQLSSHKRIY